MATLAVHALLGVGLWAIGEYVDDQRDRDEEPVEVEILPPRRVEPRTELPEPLPAPEVAEPVVEPPPQPTPPKPTRRVARTEVAKTRPLPTPASADTALAPGPDDGLGEAAPVWVMPDQGQGGTVPVAVGTPKTRRVGAGGTGSSTGGGGADDSKGKSVPTPVSVASIQRRPMPIGNTDFVDARKDYPEAAKRQGIEGSIKVKLVVDEEGRVAERRLVNRLGYGLDELALRLAKKLRFEPAIDTDGRAVAAVVVWTFHFTLPR